METSLRLFLGFLVGGVWVAATTAAAERGGSRLGGFIGGLPSTLAVALLFVALTGGREAAAEAAAVAPLAFAVNALYVLLFVALSRFGFTRSMILALTAWAAAQFSIVAHGAPSPAFSLAAWLFAFAACWIGFHRWMDIRAMPAGAIRTGPAGLTLRAAASGLLVAAAVATSLFWGAVAGGVLASLPVVFISTLFIAYRRLGLDFARALARSLVFSAVINCTVFALAFRLALHHLDTGPAFAAAYLATLLLAFPLYRLKLG
jgi:hypothetical protein